MLLLCRLLRLGRSPRALLRAVRPPGDLPLPWLRRRCVDRPTPSSVLPCPHPGARAPRALPGRPLFGPAPRAPHLQCLPDPLPGPVGPPLVDPHQALRDRGPSQVLPADGPRAHRHRGPGEHRSSARRRRLPGNQPDPQVRALPLAPGSRLHSRILRLPVQLRPHRRQPCAALLGRHGNRARRLPPGHPRARAGIQPHRRRAQDGNRRSRAPHHAGVSVPAGEEPAPAADQPPLLQGTLRVPGLAGRPEPISHRAHRPGTASRLHP